MFLGGLVMVFLWGGEFGLERMVDFLLCGCEGRDGSRVIARTWGFCGPDLLEEEQWL